MGILLETDACCLASNARLRPYGLTLQYRLLQCTVRFFVTPPRGQGRCTALQLVGGLAIDPAICVLRHVRAWQGVSDIAMLSGYTYASLLLVFLFTGATCCSALFTQRRPRSSDCLRFKRYYPSAWEEEWLSKRALYAESICQKMKNDSEHSRTWMNATWLTHSPARLTSLSAFNLEVVSYFEYQDTCNGSHSTFVPIEPLVGLLRHPSAHPACNVDEQSIDIEDRSHLLARPAFSMHLGSQAQRQRHYLFDLGCGTTYTSSIGWFVDKYAQQDVHFDEIWAWEAKATPGADFWESVPQNMSSKLHFYNSFVNADVHSAASPIQILQEHLADASMIVFKLDIDNEELEEKLVNALASRGLLSHLDDFYYEEHFNAPEMQAYFGIPSRLWTDTMQRFADYRRQGVHVHYWP